MIPEGGAAGHGGISVRGGNAQRRGGVSLITMTDTAPTDTAEEIMIVTDAARATVLDIRSNEDDAELWACESRSPVPTVPTTPTTSRSNRWPRRRR